VDNSNIEKIWNTFMTSFPYTEIELDTVVGCCKRNNINPLLFATNLFFLTGQRVNSSQEILQPTESIRTLLNNIPPAYTMSFIAAFPDVVNWFIGNYNTDEYQDNPYFLEIKNNPKKYFDENMKIKYNFILITVVAFIKSPNFSKFECSF